MDLAKNLKENDSSKVNVTFIDKKTAQVAFSNFGGQFNAGWVQVKKTAKKPQYKVFTKDEIGNSLELKNPPAKLINYVINELRTNSDWKDLPSIHGKTPDDNALMPSKENYPIFQEHSRKRLLNYMERDFCVITAFKNSYTLEQNRQRNKDLVTTLHNHQLKFFKIMSHKSISPNGIPWEQCSTEVKDNYLEDFLLVSFNSDTTSKDEFINLMFDLCKNNNQDGIILASKPEYNGVYDSDKKLIASFTDKISLDQLMANFSTWIRRTDSPFIFEEVWRPNCSAIAMGGIKAYGYLW